MSYVSTIGIGWAYRSWAGGGIASTDPGVVVDLTAVPDDGVMQIRIWWPDALVLQVIRVHPDGQHYPVRTAYPVAITDATRRNQCTNPSIEVDTTGYTAGAGSPTLSRITGTMPAGSAALRATLTATALAEVRIPHDADAGTLTLGFALRLSHQATALSVIVDWLDSGGIPLSASVASLTTEQITSSVGAFARHVLTVSAPVGATSVSTITLAATGLSTGNTVDLDAVTIEQGSTDGSFFDGDTQGAHWTGTADLSTSGLPAESVVLDGECPLDVVVSYLVTNPAVAGGTVDTESDTLSSGDFRTWLTHPEQSTTPTRAELASVPVWERAIEQGVFWPVGARHPVVVSGAQRQAPQATVDFVVLSFDERDALLELLDDGSPLLLRAPAIFGRGTGAWLAVGAVTEDAQERKAWQDAFLLSAECVQVDTPVTYDDLSGTEIIGEPTPLGYYVIEFDDGVSRWDSDDSTLNASVTATATSFAVAFTTTRWTTDAAEMPIPITVGGEDMNVTAISGTSSPQTFTVTRSVNGVVRAHSAGATVRLTRGAIFD